VYPKALLNEYELLKDFKPVLYIDPMCPITTPYDVYTNQMTGMHHGTVGVGFGETIERQEKHYTLYAKDLKYKNVVKMKLENIMRYHRFKSPHQEDQFLADVEEMLSIVKISHMIHDGDMIFEGAQGILLDQRFGFFPYVTRSYTTSENVWDLIPKNYSAVQTFLVTRAYQTRHGNGPMTNENIPITVRNEGETNVQNTYQGEFKIAPFDEELVRYAIECEEMIASHTPRCIVMTCCDQVDRIPELSTHYPINYNYSPEGDFTAV
jgi:adenylosuccinate synthase